MSLKFFLHNRTRMFVFFTENVFWKISHLFSDILHIFLDCLFLEYIFGIEKNRYKN
jgi:hypothetical protein